MSDTLKIILDAVTKPFQRDMDDGEKAVKKFSDNGKTSLGEFKKFAMGALSVGAAVQFGKELAGIGIEAHDMSRQLQMGAEDLQAYQELFRKNRVEADEYRSAISALRVFQQEALEGDEMAIQMFEKLGISMDELSGKLAPELFQDVARGMVEMEDQTAAFMAIAKIFGEDAGPKLMGIFQDLNDLDFEAYKAGLKESGKVMDEELTQRLADAETQIQSFTRQLKIFVGNEVLGNENITDVASALGRGTLDNLKNILRPDKLLNPYEQISQVYGLTKDQLDRRNVRREEEPKRLEEEKAAKERRDELTLEAQKRTAEATQAEAAAKAKEKADKEAAAARKKAQQEEMKELQERIKRRKEFNPFDHTNASAYADLVREAPFTAEGQRETERLERKLDELKLAFERNIVVKADW